jgi:hypothetical protein
MREAQKFGLRRGMIREGQKFVLAIQAIQTFMMSLLLPEPTKKKKHYFKHLFENECFGHPAFEFIAEGEQKRESGGEKMSRQNYQACLLLCDHY